MNLKVAMPFVMLLLAAVVPLLHQRYAGLNPMQMELRQLRVQRLQQARALGVLKENSDLVGAITESVVSKDDLTLSLLESTKRYLDSSQFKLEELTVSVSDNSEIEASLTSLRVSVSAQLSKAVDLLSLFDAVQTAAQWRPIEVRGCTLSRVAQSEAHRLRAKCAIDVYRFMDEA